MNEKIKEINEVNGCLEQLKSFLNLLEMSNVESSYGTAKDKKWNDFYRFTVESYIWSGSSSSGISKRIDYKEVMNKLSDVMKPLLRVMIEEKEMKLKSLLSN